MLAFSLVALACSSEDEPAQSEVSPDATEVADECLWAMAGHDLGRSHTSRCEESISADSLERLVPVWFHETDAEVTGAPVVDADSVYFADWSGKVRALDRSDGSEIWVEQLPTSEHVYAGQSPASAALTTIDSTDALIATSGHTVVALSRADGSTLWSQSLADPEDPEDPTEIEGAVVVTGDTVLVPSDVHGADGYPAGLVALSLADGEFLWRFDPEEGTPATGCSAIWGSPAVDPADDLVVIGTGNCHNQESWTEASEAIVGLDLQSGELRWSYQPHEPDNLNDWDFAGAPNLYSIGDRAVAGLGNKDGHYYVVDRTDGELVWEAEAQRQTGTGDGFAFGGFIGALALADGVLVGGTAVGDCPCQHAFDAATGELIWQSNEPTGTYAAAAAVSPGDGEPAVAFQTGIDQTLRAFNVVDGEVLWESTLRSISSSGPAIAGDSLFIGVGFREPGSPASGGGGVQAFRVLAEGEKPPESSTTTIPEGDSVTSLKPSTQDCVGSPCEIPFTLKTPPSGTDPRATIEITTDPFGMDLVVEDLGDPEDWLDPDGPAAADGAGVFMVFITPRDDRPELGSILCTFTEGEDGCSASEIPIPADSWTRLSILAAIDENTPPTLQEGFDRLVTTHSFDPALEAS